MIAKFLKFSFGGWISAGIAFLSTPVISNLLLPEDFGRASLILLTYSLLLQSVLLGIDQSFVREYYLAKNRHSLLKGALKLPLMLSFLFSLGLVVIYKPLSIYLIGKEDLEIVVCLSITVIVATVERFTTLNVRMAQNGFMFSIIRAQSALVTFLVTLSYAIYISKDLFAIVYGNLAGILSSVLVALVLNVKPLVTAPKMIEIKTMDLVRYGLPFVPAFMIGWLFEAIDRVALKEFSTYEQLGLYSAAYKIVAALTILQTTFSTFWTPISFEAYQKDSNETKLLFQKIFRVLSMVFLIGGLIIISIKDIVIGLFSSQYSAAATIVPFLVFVPIMYTLSEVTVGGINFKKKTYLHLIISGVSALVNLSLVLLLVPRFGAKGAAFATATAYIVFFYLRTYLSILNFPIAFDLSKLSAGICVLFIVAFINTALVDRLLIMVINIFSIFSIIYLYKDIVSMFYDRLCFFMRSTTE